MNDRRENDEAKLLAGAFHDDWTNGPIADFARVAAARARGRRAVRRTGASLGAAAALALAFFVALRSRPAALPEKPALATARPRPVAKPAYEIISDDELIAQLRDRPLLIVKKDNGAKEIHLLEDAPPLE